jgi:hypothetical protein
MATKPSLAYTWQAFHDGLSLPASRKSWSGYRLPSPAPKVFRHPRDDSGCSNPTIDNALELTR